MKAILMSIHPVWCEKIFSGIKTIEVRKTRPKLTPPFKVYVYMTATKERFPLWEYVTTYQNSKGDIVNGSQKVIGEFVCNKITELPCETTQPNWLKEKTCLSDTEYMNYLGHKNGYGWHITEPKLFDEPKELDVFWAVRCINKKGDCKTCCEKPACINNITRPPQSWCYLEVEE